MFSKCCEWMKEHSDLLTVTALVISVRTSLPLLSHAIEQQECFHE